MAVETVDSLCQKARQAVAQGHNEEARQLYAQALGLKADAPDVHYGLATVCFLLNDLTSASHHFKEVTRLDPLRAGAYINLGAVYNLLDRLEDAIAVLQRGIQLDTHRAEGYYNLGLAYKRKGQPQLAIQAYREAARVSPSMSDAHLNLANIYMDTQQYGLAAAHYRQALEVRPTWDKAREGLDMAEAAQHAQDQTPQPARTVEQAEALTPKLDLDRNVDPNVHGALLTSLHKATIESENHGRQFLEIVEAEIEPAIKELSTCLLYPTSSARELDRCVQKFEQAIQSMRSAQRTLQSSILRVRTLGDRLQRS